MTSDDEEAPEAELRGSTALARARLWEDIAALSVKLSVKNGDAEVEQAAVRAWEKNAETVIGEARRFARSAVNLIRRNPVPVFMLGGVVTGLLVWRARSAL